jgi:hypothetical protein
LKQPRESRREIDKRKATQTISFHGDARSNIPGKKKKQTNKNKKTEIKKTLFATNIHIH